MKTEIKKLTGLVNLALSANALFPVSDQEILQAFNNLEKAVQQIAYSSGKPAVIKKHIDRAITLLSVIMYNMNSPNLNSLLAAHPLLRSLINTMYSQLNKFAELYNPPPVEFDNTALLPLDNLCKTIYKLEEKMLQRWNNNQPFTILQPYITVLRKTKCLPYHRWHWWSRFCGTASPLLKGKEIDLGHILTGLNFNTPEYINWLIAHFKQEVALKKSASAKLDYLSDKIIQYKFLSGDTAAFIPASATVKQVIIAALKQEFKLHQSLPSTSVPALDQSPVTKLNTEFSVPQLALFIRLMIDAKIINETNQSALLKNIAAIICTSKTASVSSESLRINYYTPNSSAKNIVKNYLLNMLNLLHSY